MKVYKSLAILPTSGNLEDTTVQAAYPNDYVFEVTADDVKQSGFTMKGAKGILKAGIYLYHADHCHISNNTAYVEFMEKASKNL